MTSHWGEMSELKDPLDIDAAMKEQKAKCDDLLERKNQVISDIKEFLKDMDVGYYEDLDKQVIQQYASILAYCCHIMVV